MDVNVVLLISILTTQCGTQTVQNVKDLRTYLFTTNAYDVRVRPIANQSDPVDISFGLSLINIVNLDVVQEVLYASVVLNLSWNDTELGWDPTSYGDLQSIQLPQGDVWTPNIILKNSQSGASGLGYAALNVKVWNNGTVEWFPSETFAAICNINVKYFPFDTQTCPLTFIAYGYLPSEVILSGVPGGVDIGDYETSPIWTLVSTSYSVEVQDDDVKIVFNIELKRKALFTVISVILPVLMLTFLNLCVFFVPCTGGEKSGYSVTIFLSFAVFLTLVEATMPPTSSPISLLSVYMIIMTAESTVITIITQIMIRCSTFDEKKTIIPHWLIVLAELGKFKYCRAKCVRSKNDEVTSVDEKADGVKGVVEAFEDNTKSEKIYTWVEVMNGLDCFLFIVFGIFTVLVAIVMLSVLGSS
ncbi:Neuronal acetylcholine receptor subunit alpha-7 [Mactra antiquata]